MSNKKYPKPELFQPTPEETAAAAQRLARQSLSHEEKDQLIANLYRCIDEQKGHIEMMHKMLESFRESHRKGIIEKGIVEKGNDATDVASSAFSEGDKIAWSAIVNGKVVRLKGDISSIVGETMCCIGKCVATGNWWRDYVSIHDKSVSRL